MKKGTKNMWLNQRTIRKSLCGKLGVVSRRALKSKFQGPLADESGTVLIEQQFPFFLFKVML